MFYFIDKKYAKILFGQLAGTYLNEGWAISAMGNRMSIGNIS